MTFKVRVASWFILLIGGFTVLFSVIDLVGYLMGGEFRWFTALGSLIGVMVVVLVRDFPLLKVTPDRIVSITNMGWHTIPLGPRDQLAYYDDRLFVWRANTGWTEVPVYRTLLRGRDWHEFTTAIHERWPPNVAGYWHA
jgi:hypothetical protein